MCSVKCSVDFDDSQGHETEQEVWAGAFVDDPMSLLALYKGRR